MDKNNYNIDDILSEVKKRRAAEFSKKPEEQANEPEQKEAPAADETSDLKAEEAPESITQEVAKEEPFAEEPPKEEKPEMVNLFELAAKDEPVQEEEELELSEEPDRTVPEDELIPSKPDEPQPQPTKKKKKKKSKTQKILTAVIAALVTMIIAAIAVLAFTANDWINEIINNSKDDVSPTETTEEWQGMKTLVESFDPIKETEADEIASMEDMIKTWYHNGTPCSSTHVLNVLLIGEDTRGKNILDEGTRADSAIIASVNIDTGEVILTSILRDAWAYWETEPGKESTGQFGKINGAMSVGDIHCYMRTIEQLYKIKLDGHAIVNFTSFKAIVNALGGVDIEITADEIKEINSHPKTYGDVWITKKFDGDKGVQTLNGRQALAYCRIRHIDSDGARADRQKTCLVQIFEKAKKSSKTTQLKIIKELIPYVKTSFGKNEIIKIARYAFSKGWLDYDMITTNVPEMNFKGGNFKPEYGGQWIWKADFPADAYMVQKRIYGKSSITLAKVRVDVKKVKQTGVYADGARATTATYVNKNYKEESTVPTTAKPKKAKTTTSN